MFLWGSKGTAAKTVSHSVCVCIYTFVDLFHGAACLHLVLLIVVFNIGIKVMELRV